MDIYRNTPTSPQTGLTHLSGGNPPVSCPAEVEQQGSHEEGPSPHGGFMRLAPQSDDGGSAPSGTLQPPGVTLRMQGDVRTQLTKLGAYTALMEQAKQYGPRTLPSSINLEERTDLIFELLGDFDKTKITADQRKELRESLRNFCYKFEAKRLKVKSDENRFRNQNQAWLSQEFEFPDFILPFLHPSKSPQSQSDVENIADNENVETRSFESYSSRHQLRLRRSLKTELEGHSQAKILKVIPDVVKAGDKELQIPAKRDFEFVLSACLTTPTRASKMASCIRKAGSLPTPYEPEEALALIVDRKMTKETYVEIRRGLMERGYSPPPYPAYHRITEARKACYPEETLHVTEVEASVSLQGLLTHTFNRIVIAYDETFNALCNRQNRAEIHCNFEVSWGFDGSTGQSFYKQALPGSENEHGLFATTLIPLRIATNEKQIVWLNPAPQSYRYCRPLRIQFRKETKELILQERDWVQAQIEELSPVSCQTSSGYLIVADCKLTLAIIDGKVLSTLLETPCQLRCPFCKATASQFNDLTLKFRTVVDVSMHGLSPLHAWIRVLEFLLHLGYRNDPRVMKWRILKSSKEAPIVEARKKQIQDEVKAKLSLLVDIVRPCSGTSNDGNTARRALSEKHRGTFADILGIQRWLLDDLHIILIVISCGLPIDGPKFGAFCRSVAEKYVSTYNWFHMPVTIHKILCHGQEIIETTALPIGMLSEQAGEARNKYWRHDREHHTRKSRRELTMIDLFHRALESSDPVISDYRLLHRHKKLSKLPIPARAISLLRPYTLQECGIDDTEGLEIAVSQILEGNHVDLTDDTLILQAEIDLFSTED